MKLKVNGEERQVDSDRIDALLKELEAPAQGVAVALNGRVVRRGEHGSTELHEGDEVEIIRAVQGG